MDFPKSVPSVGLVDGKFVDEDVVAGTPGSLIPAQWGNAVTEEVLNVISSASLTPDEDNNAQLLAAINAKITAAIPVSPPDASATVKGLVELATDAETQAGTDSVRAVTPAGLSARTATESSSGLVQLATQAEAEAGTSTIKVASVLRLWQAITKRIATQAQVNAGADDTTIVTPKKLATWVDPWAMQPIGALIALLDNGSVPSPPVNSSLYRYIRLTASDSYNTGILTSEAVSGSAPLVVATAVVNLAGSPFNGVTVNLINTERRFLRAGLPGVVQQDALQGHWHDYWYASGGRDGTTFTDGFNAPATIKDARGPTYARVRDAISDGVNGTPRVDNETRAKSMGATYYMRVK